MFEISKMSFVLKRGRLTFTEYLPHTVQCAVYSFLNQLFIELYVVGAVLSPGEIVVSRSEEKHAAYNHGAYGLVGS